MSEKTDYSEFKKSELENWIELSHAFLDNQGVPRKDGGTLSIYGRIERYSVIKSQELAALRSELDALKEALEYIRNYDNYASDGDVYIEDGNSYTHVSNYAESVIKAYSAGNE